MNLFIKNIKELGGIQPTNKIVLKGEELGTFHSISNAYLIARDGLISSFGKMEDLDHDSIPSEAMLIDAANKMVLPAFCDSHTHLVFAATRENEFVDKIAGLSYEAIAQKGGGILNSAQKLSGASVESLIEDAVERLNEIRNQGTCAVEIKSGYGLSVESEIKMLRIIRKLKDYSPLSIKSTFLGAHALPAQYKTSRDEYVRIVIEEMLPQIAEEGLADYCDVFCENGFFTPRETEKILQAALKYNLKPKIHANQLARSGGVQAGVNNGAVSVDHLENIGKDEIETLKNSSTIATLLPGAAFFLRLPYPPARELINEKVAVALASDYNPGSAPCGRMSFVISLACIQMKLTPAEAFNAATLNGASAMELARETGSVTVGKRANLIVTKKINSLSCIPYFFGTDCIEQTFVDGKL